MTFAVAILGENVATLPFELKSMFWSVKKQRALCGQQRQELAPDLFPVLAPSGGWQLSPPFLRTQVSAWLLVGSVRRTEGCLLRRLCDTLRLQRNPATWDTGVSEKYVADHGLGISFWYTE